MTEKLIQYDGRTVKMASLWGGPEEGWQVFGQPDKQTADVKDLYKAIPWMFRGVQLRADAIARMPFAVVNVKSGEDLDTSQNWKNAVGFMPNPAQLFRQIEASVCLAGKAYLWRQYVGSKTLNLRYLAPQSVHYEVKSDGSIKWQRDTGQGMQDIPDESIVYIWPPDPFVELGAAQSYPAAAALSAAGVLLNMESFVSAFFKRGAIKTTIFSATNMSKDQAEHFEAWYKKLITGIKHAFTTKVINAEKLEPVVIGEGIQELSNVTLTDEMRRDIAAAFGIPFALLFSEAANYATARQDDRNFLEKTIIPECRFLEGALNEQVFTPLGLRLVFREDGLDAFQEDEAAHAQALSDMVTALQSPDEAELGMRVLGFELDADAKKLLAKIKADKASAANKPPAQPVQPIAQPVQMPARGEEDKRVDDQIKSELAKWERKSIKAFKAGKSANVPFVFTCNVDRMLVDDIEESLQSAKTADDVKAAFAQAQSVSGSAQTFEKALIEELVKARKALIEQPFEPSQPIIQVNIPEQPAPQVVVNVPEQKPPVVNVNLPPKKPMRVTRDRDGRISGIEEK